MIYGATRILKYLLGTDVAGRSMAVRRDDTFIVSYPRSGNTWTRFLVANLLHPKQVVTFANIEQLIPDAEAQSNRYMKRIPTPRVVKSHQYFDHRYKNVIYIVRDPRDVAVSYYDFSRKYRYIPDGFSLDQYVSDFVHGRLSSASWGTWAENVGTWVAARYGQPNFLLLRYEDLIGNTEVELAKMAVFFKIDPSPELLRCAAERSTSDRMRALEGTEGKEWISTKGKRPDVPFIGSAVPGKWRSKLTTTAIAEIESAWSPLMTRLGYKSGTSILSSEPSSAAPLHEPLFQLSDSPRT